MEAVANVILGAVMLAIVAFWIYALANYDGEPPCEPGSDDCKDCPFPCEHNKHD